MKLSDVITPGDKIDIKMLHEANQEDNGGEIAKIYQSAVSDIFSDQELEISMPTSGGRMVLFQLERECSIVFYTKGGMYNCTAVVKKRYRKENLYLLRIVITSGLQKFQRREFFRIPYTTPLKFYEISEQTAQLQTTEELFAEIQKSEYMDQVREGTTQNISGGGIRFVTGQSIKQNQNILLVIRLTNEYSDETFYLPGQVIATEKHPAIEEMYIHRVKFLFRDLRDREKIVRFVFEEERRIRRKEVG